MQRCEKGGTSSLSSHVEVIFLHDETIENGCRAKKLILDLSFIVLTNKNREKAYGT
jgi:hypothetical protein